jgi:Protein of unknown function (DUF3568)
MPTRRPFRWLAPALVVLAGCESLIDDTYRGTAATYSYLRGQVSRSYPCAVADARAAARAILLHQGLAIERDLGGDREAVLASRTTSGEPITINIEAVPTAPPGLPATRVGVRVESLSDDTFARRLLEQIAVRLPPPPLQPATPPPDPPPPHPALTQPGSPVSPGGPRPPLAITAAGAPAPPSPDNRR